MEWDREIDSGSLGVGRACLLAVWGPLTCDSTGNDHAGRDVPTRIVRALVVVAIVPGRVSRPSLSTANKRPLGVENLTSLGGRPIRMQPGRSRVHLQRRMVED